MSVENVPAHIGKTIVICGEVKGSEDLIVDGRVEGTVTLLESRLTIGPNAKTGKNVSPPTITITPTSSATNKPLSVGNVPDDGGTSFFSASDPATASIGTIMAKRPSSIAKPIVML